MFGFLARQEDKPSSEKALQVFISYSRMDKLITDRVVGGLIRRGIDVMIDTSDMHAGDVWREELQRMIQAADTVIGLVSNNSMGSDEVRKELETLQSLNKRLVPIRIDDIDLDDLPPTINRLHLLSLLPSDDFDAQLDSLAVTLNVPKAWVQNHTWLGDQARRGIRLRGEVLKDAKLWLQEKPKEAEPPTQEIVDHIAHSSRISNRIRYLTLASAAGMLAMITLGLKWYDDFRKDVQMKTFIAESKSLAVESEQETERGNAALGINLALQGLPDPEEGRKRPVVVEAERALYRALSNLRQRVVFDGHDKPLTHAEMNPIGDRVVTTSTDGLAGLWTIDGELLQQLEGHKKAVTMAKFSPDGTRIVTISEDLTGILWDHEGKQIATLAGHTRPVLFTSFSHDSSFIVTTSADFTARLWSAVDGKPLKTFKGHRAAIAAADFSPDDRMLATVSADQTGRLWAIEDDHEPIILDGHSDRVLDIDFSPQRNLIAMASRDGDVIIWNMNGDIEKHLQGHYGVINTVRFAPDGLAVVTASDDNTAKVWATADGKEIATLRGHESRVIYAEFDDDQSKIMTASVDGAIGLWKVADVEETGDLCKPVIMRGHNDGIVTARLSTDGQSIISAGNDHTARLWDAGKDPPRSTGLHHDCDVRSLAFSRDGSRLVSACKDGNVTLWDIEALRRSNERDVGDLIISTALSTDGQRLALAHEDGSATIWNTDRLQLVGRVKSHAARVRSVEFNGDGTRLLTSSADGTAKIWDVLTQKEVLALVGHDDRVRTAVFSHDDRKVLTVSADKTAKIWDSVSGALLQTFDVHEADVWAADFSPDGSKIVTGSVDGQIFLIDLTKPDATRRLVGHGDNIRSAEFSPDGSQILTSSWDRTVRLWDVDKAEAVAVLDNEDIILDAAFDPNGGRIAHIIQDKVLLRPTAVRGQESKPEPKYPSVEELVAAAKAIRPHDDF